MLEEKEPALKEKYSLWLECFKRNDEYKKLIKQFPTRKKFELGKSRIKLSPPHLAARYSRVLNESYFAWKVFQFFADAIYRSFEYWWKKNFPKGERKVEEITEEWYQKKDLKYLPAMVISIPILGNLEQLVEEFWKLIGPAKRELENLKTKRFRLLVQLRREERRRRQMKNWLYPEESFRVDKIKEYLEIYDKISQYRKNKPRMTLKEIYCKENPELADYLDLYSIPIGLEEKTQDEINRDERKGKQADAGFRLFKLHWKKANKIIHNAAWLTFPNPY